MLFILQATFEAIGIVGAGTVLAGKKLPLQGILVTGALGGLSAWVFRSLPLKFGIHTILTIMIYIVFQRLILGLNLKIAIVAALLGFTLLGLLEYVSLNIWVVVSGVTIDNLLEDDLLRFFASIPSLLGLWLVWLCGGYLRKKDRV